MKNRTIQGASTMTVFLVASMTVLLSSVGLLLLNQLGLIAFTGAGWMVSVLNLISEYLGYSLLFFIPAFLGYGLFFILLKRSLSRFPNEPEQMENIRFYNTGTELFITLCFAIGVLFTAWGLQNALVSALGGVSREEASRLGAWGILRQLVENGFLIAFWTTIVGGACAYGMRILKFLSVGRELGRISIWQSDQQVRALFESLDTIKDQLEQIEQNSGHNLSRESHVSAR